MDGACDIFQYGISALLSVNSSPLGALATVLKTKESGIKINQISTLLFNEWLRIMMTTTATNSQKFHN